jgi:exopolyphosphatase / guanosine-5'-triphosphate,3'-diphosphate pyrophosphatase
MTDTLAALDMGTNSFHLVVARVVDGAFEVIAREKEMVRLGEGAGDMKRLSTAAMDRGIEALRRMKRIADIDGATLRAVATSAVREAQNAPEFLRRASAIGVEVEVIPGVEEARLIHLGVLQAVPVFDRRLLLCDIGGGSTELLVGHQGETEFVRSLKMGAVRLATRFFPSESDQRGAVDECRDYCRSILQPLRRHIAKLNPEVFVASSGTAEAMAEVIKLSRDGEALRTYNRFEFSADELHDAVNRLARAGSNKARREIPGVDAKRSDILLPGAVILSEVLRVFDVDTVIFSGNALREGVLFDMVSRSAGRGVQELRDSARRSVVALMEACDDEPDHARTVARLALRLFDILVPLHRLDDGARAVLEAAALLANVGQYISHDGHHLHSYYVIRNSERLVGFTDAEIELIAQVARYHRKSAPKPSHEAFAALDSHSKKTVQMLAGLLRVAIGLDRSHDGRVVDIDVSWSSPLQLIAIARADLGDGEDLDLELYAANQRSALLCEQMDREFRVVAGQPKLP